MESRPADLIELWLTESGYLRSTVVTYRNVMLRFDRRYPGVLPHVTEALIREFLTTLTDGSPRDQAPNTVKGLWRPLRAFCRWAAERRLIDGDPAAGGQPVRVGSGRVRRGRWLSEDEARRLLDACVDETPRGLRDQALISLALLTGLRSEELAKLCWCDLDAQGGVLSVLGKGAKPALVGVPDQAVQALEIWRRFGASHTLEHFPIFPRPYRTGGLNGQPDEYRFHWHEPASPFVLRHALAFRAERACIGHLAPHDLRRSFAGFLDRRGTDLRSIQAAMRHESPNTTFRHYLERDPTRAVRAVEGLTI